MSISNHPVEHEELMAYLDGELLPDQAVDTAAHLEECPDCQRLSADLQDVSEMLRIWQVEETELELSKKTAAVLAQREPANNDVFRHHPNRRAMFSKRVLLWGSGFAALAVIVFALSVSRMRAPRGFVDSASIGPKKSQEQKGDAVAAQLQSYTRRPQSGVGSVGKLQKDEPAGVDGEEGQSSNVPAVNGPMIVRTAHLEVTTKEFDRARSSVEEILKRRHGYVGELNVNTPAGSARSLTGTLRVPATELEAALAEIKGLGQTEKESQGGEEVTQQYVDLQARLANARHTEQRLVEMLRDRTGKLADVLAVEMQISRVRGEIEEMEAQRKTMKNQVDFATLSLTVNEEYKEQLKAVPASTSTLFRNAAVEGYRTLVDGIIAVLLWLLSVGPTLLIWAAILFFPARMVWRRVRDRRDRA